MVIDYSMKSGEEAFSGLKKEQEGSMNRLTGLIDEDCKVFGSLMQALSEKQDAQEKYIASAKVPLEVCRECKKSLEVTISLRKRSNKNLASDVECAVHILKAAFNAARINVEVNLQHIKDEGFLKSTGEELNELNSDIESMIGE
jgi:formiminotetrahydrofolate cyclodeaminase